MHFSAAVTQLYDFDRIEEAAADAAAGRMIKPVLRIGSAA
jgi:Zn-dependent alcohol dehydrogenase